MANVAWSAHKQFHQSAHPPWMNDNCVCVTMISRGRCLTETYNRATCIVLPKQQNKKKNTSFQNNSRQLHQKLLLFFLISEKQETERGGEEQWLGWLTRAATKRYRAVLDWTLRCPCSAKWTDFGTDYRLYPWMWIRISSNLNDDDFLDDWAFNVFWAETLLYLETFCWS